MSTKIKLTKEQIKENPFITKGGTHAFNNLINSLVGKTVPSHKIKMAKNIEDSWYNYAREHQMDCYKLSDDIVREHFSARGLFFPADTVEIMD